MALDAGSVYVKLGGKLDASGFQAFNAQVFKSKAAMDKAERSINRSSFSIGRAVKGTLAGFATYKAVRAVEDLVGVLVDATKTAAGFHQELKNTQAVSGARARDIAKLRKAALDLGTSFGVGATKAAQAATELVKGGLSIKQVIGGGLKGAISLAVAGNLDLAQAATTVANALNLFGLKGGQATHVADALATAANATTADVGDFALALSQGGGAAKAAGLSFNETIGALEALALAGVKGSDAGTSLKTALVQLASPTKQQAEAAKKLNLEFFDQQGKMKPLPQIAGMLQDKLGGLTKQQRLNALSTIAGTDGMRALLALYDQGPGKLRKLEDGLKKQGTAAKVAATQNQSAQGAMRKLSASWEQAQIIFGEQLLPVVSNVAQQITGKLDELAANGDIKKFGKEVGDTASDIARDAPKIVSTIGDAAHDIAAVASPIGKALNFAIIQPTKATLIGTLEIVSGILKAFQAVASVGAALHIPGASAAKNALDSAGDSIDNLKDKIEGLGRSHVKATISTNANAVDQQIAGVKVSLDSIPKRVVTRIQHNADSAKGATLAYKAVLLGVPARKVVQILQNASSAAGEVNGLRAAIAALPSSKTITLTTIRNEVTNDIRHIQSSPFPFTPNVSRGNRKAAGGKTNGPQLYMVGEGSDPVEWIIPRDPAYRGRAVGLLMDAAKSILPGAKKGAKHDGKGKPKHHRIVPAPPHDWRVGDPDQLKQEIDRLQQYRSEKHTSGRQKGHLTARAVEARREYAKLHPVYVRAKHLADRITANQERADNAFKALQNADNRNDTKGFNSNLKSYKRYLGNERSELEEIYKALRHAGRADTTYGRSVRSKLLDIGGSLSSLPTSGAQQAADQAAQDLADTGMTPAEQAQLAKINAQQALAALTPDLGDDTAAAAAKVSFLQGILNEVTSQPARGGDTTIADIAGQLRSAQDDLASLTGTGTAVNTSPDVQAQIDQARAQGFASGLGQAINTGAAAAFGGVGSIGAGTGFGQPSTVVNINTLHPGTPQVWTALAKASNAGNDYMLTRRNALTPVGPR